LARLAKLPDELRLDRSKTPAEAAAQRVGGLADNKVSRKGPQSTQAEIPGIMSDDEHKPGSTDGPTETASPQSNSLSFLLGEKPGQRIGNYRFLKLIGEGGMGSVWLAEQIEPVRRQVALKLIKFGMYTPEAVIRFEAERQALALMDHPNIARVLDAAATNAGRPYFVMELVQGVKITEYCDEKKLSVADRLKLFVTVCRAIQHAHQKGVIHRDIKPSNILITPHDDMPVAKVIDFGIAKAVHGRLTDQSAFTAFEQLIGTPAYMSPEQAAAGGTDIDTRSDIYSLGVVLYELLAGELPFSSSQLKGNPEEIRRILREQEPLRPSIQVRRLAQGDREAIAQRRRTEPSRFIHMLQGDLDCIVMKCLEKDRTRRYQTANGIASDLQRHLDHEPVLARPPSLSYQLWKTVRRHKVAVSSVTAIALALLVGFGMSVWQAVRATKAESKVKETLVASDLAQAGRLISDGFRNDAVAYLVRSSSVSPGSQAVITRLVTLLTYNEWMAPALILEHKATVDSVQFSRDGNRIATGSYDNTAQIWDAHSGKPLLAQPLYHSNYVYCATFSADGLFVVTASEDSTACVWNATNGQLIASLKHSKGVISAQFSSDGKRVLTASRDGTARIWNAGTGEPSTNPVRHQGLLYMAEFSADGKRIVTASEDGTARVWDAETAQETLPSPLRHKTNVVSAQFSPDGKYIATTSWDQTTRIWDAATGDRRIGPLTNTWRVWSAQFSPDCQRVLTASGDGTARVWDAATGIPLTPPMRSRATVWSARFSPDGKRIITGSADYTARVWDATTGNPVAEPLRHGNQVWSSVPWTTAQFSPDGKRILTPCSDGKARVWVTLGGSAQPLKLVHGKTVHSAAFNHNGTKVVTGSDDGSARIWDSKSGAQLASSLLHDSPVLMAQFSLDGGRIVTACQSGAVRVWNATSGKPLTGTMLHGAAVNSALFSRDGKKIVSASEDGSAVIWDAESGKRLGEPLRHLKAVLFAEFSPDGNSLVTASFDFTGRIWDVRTGNPIGNKLQHDGVVATVRFSPKGERVVTCSDDLKAQVWDSRTGKPLGKPMAHGATVWSVQFSSDGNRIVTCSSDTTARVWDSTTGLPLTQPLQHDKPVLIARFSPDGNQIATGSADQTVRVWDAQTGQPLSEPFPHNGKILSLEWSPDGNRLLTASTNDVARIWDVVPSRKACPRWVADLAEAMSGQTLDSRGILVLSANDRAKTIHRIREELNRSADSEGWVAWGRWLLGSPSERGASPLLRAAPVRE
jgi:eukaryotic-like serine/threonine-protein kinase